jgi:hypothetical protein
LTRLLRDYSGHSEWQVKLKGGSQSEPGSLAHEEQAARVQQRDEKKRDIENHPRVKSIQKVFPGSKVEFK